MTNDPSVRLQFLKGIGPKRAEQLSAFGLTTVEDLLYFFPRAYQDRTHIVPIAQVALGSVVTIQGRITAQEGRQSYWRRSFSVVEVSVADASGRLFAVWFNQPYMGRVFKVGDRVLVHGKVELYKDRIQISSPDYEILDQDQEVVAPGIVPVYSLPRGFSQRSFRRFMEEGLDRYLGSVKEVLPFDLRQRHRLLNIAQSLRQIHFPDSEENRRQAYLRLSFEEFFLYQIPVILRKRRKKEKRGIPFRWGDRDREDFEKILPFVLTDAQKRVIDDIQTDMALSSPMQRLLQGDVGSGKTVVAFFAALLAVKNGCQAVVMAPTEILAGQHAEKIQQLLSGSSVKYPVASGQKKIRIGLLTGSLSAKEKKEMIPRIKKGEIDIIIGTHALLQEGVRFHKVGLIVIDEQHKFGVSQRALLPEKGANPHVLIMTATPIPRTLALTLYGDLDISCINELPAGRQRVSTEWFFEDERLDVFERVRGELKAGRQAFIVYPVTKNNPKLELASARSMFKEFRDKIFKEFRVGLIHGKLKRTEQEAVMRDFRSGGIDILVATSVLEVGIDVPNASVMVIEHADRFGLSQLHQMRGRIGRGPYPSFCYLLADEATQEAGVRLKAMVEYLDGFKIAEEDLRLRGPGEYFGARQHGLTGLKIANPLTQMHLLKAAREEAVRLVDKDPFFNSRPHQEIRRQLYRRYPEFERFVEVG